MDKIKTFFSKLTEKDAFHVFISSLWCIVISLILGLLILLIINPSACFRGMTGILLNNLSFTDSALIAKYAGETLAKTAPLLIMSLGVTFAYKAGLFNIGGSGQYTIGVILAIVFAAQLNLGWPICLLMAIIGGALWGIIPGILKAYFNVNEVISCILLNWIALYLANMIIPSSPSMWDSSTQFSITISSGMNGHLPTLGLNNLFGGCETVGLGLILAIITAIVISILFKKTTFGFEIKATGFSKDAAKASGIAEKKNIIVTMLISGGLAGFSAGIAILCGQEVWKLSSNTPAIGFDGISAAFLGGVSPIGSIFSSYFITHIKDGGAMITDLGYNPQVSELIVAVIIYSCGFVAYNNERRREGKKSLFRLIKDKFDDSKTFIKKRKEIK